MLILNQNIITLLNDDALRTFPDECCGFLLGREIDNDRIIDEIIIVNNAKEGDKKRRFEISPLDYLQAEKAADESGLTLLGIYHSHPNHPSIPSEHDRVAAQPFFSYLIISVIQDEIVSYQSWTLNDEFQFEEEQVLIEEQIETIKQN